MSDVKSRVVEIIRWTLKRALDRGFTNEVVDTLASEYAKDHPGVLLASAPVVPSVEELAALLQKAHTAHAKSDYPSGWQSFYGDIIRNHLLTLGYKDNAPCEWKQDEDGNWFTACGEGFTFIDGGPSQNKMKFCSYCGRPLKEIGWREK